MRDRVAQTCPDRPAGTTSMPDRISKYCSIPTGIRRRAGRVSALHRGCRPATRQALRFDPFSMGAHYHIRPGLADQIPLPVTEGQNPLDATMAFFEKPLRFRGLLALAEEDDVASQLRDGELKNAASRIRVARAAARTGETR